MVCGIDSRKFFLSLWLLTVAVAATGSVYLITLGSPTTAIAQEEVDGNGLDAAAPAAEPPPKKLSYLGWAFDALGWGYALVFLITAGGAATAAVYAGPGTAHADGMDLQQRGERLHCARHRAGDGTKWPGRQGCDRVRDESGHDSLEQ